MACRDLFRTPRFLHWIKGQSLRRKLRAPFQRRRAIAQKVLSGQNAIGVVPPQGAMYLMLDIRATGLTGDDFANALLDEHHIAVMPGESFGQAAAGHIRVAMTIDDAKFEQALRTLTSFAEAHAA